MFPSEALASIIQFSIATSGKKPQNYSSVDNRKVSEAMKRCKYAPSEISYLLSHMPFLSAKVEKNALDVT